MNEIKCPTCDVHLPAEEITAGWCETCGKRIPLYVLSGQSTGGSNRNGDAQARTPRGNATGSARTERNGARPRHLLIFLIVFACGLVGGIVGGAADGFRSGGRVGQAGGMAGVGLGVGISQALGLWGRKRGH